MTIAMTIAEKAPLTGAAHLLTGEHVAVRPARASDAPALLRLHDLMSPESLRRRFFGAGSELAHEYLTHLEHSPQTIASVVCGNGRILGLGTAELIDPDCAEVAFVVDEASHGLGLGTILLADVAARAKAQGIRHLEADVLRENHDMLDVFAHAGFDMTTTAAGDTIHVYLQT